MKATEVLMVIVVVRMGLIRVVFVDFGPEVKKLQKPIIKRGIDPVEVVSVAEKAS